MTTANLPTEENAFREYAREWLEKNPPEAPSFRMPQSPLEVMSEAQRDYLKTWQKHAYTAGLVGCDYPAEYGGHGLSGMQRIANEEMTRAKAPFLINIVGLSMTAPTLLTHGTEELKKRFIPKILSGDELWCQGFSEPGAGSDLANVQTRAVRQDDTWFITGHKVWTTLAHFADWMILLARTSSEEKHGGLTYFIVPIAAALSSGVSVKPLIKMTGETGFNEVLFDNLSVTDTLRVDEEGKGWTVAMTTLLHERGAGGITAPATGGSALASERSAGALVVLSKKLSREGRPLSEDVYFRDRIMRLVIREEGMKQDLIRAGCEALVDHPLRLPLQAKLLLSEHLKEVAALATEMLGQRASLYLGDENAVDEARWTLGYMNAFGFTIAAGTNEIQKMSLASASWVFRKPNRQS